VEATERNEVKGFGYLEPLQAVWHDAIVNSAETLPEDPLIAIRPR
jgi:hypothetical protein